MKANTRIIALPQEHGSWVFILSPLIIGFFAARTFNLHSAALFVAAMCAFLLRQPMSILVKVYRGRRPRHELNAARFWVALYSLIGLAALAFLLRRGFFFLLWLAVPGAPVFLWHLYLISRRAERRQMAIEIVATGVLSLAAPAALWVSQGRYDPAGWWLWLLCWLQGAASIVYAFVRLEQREWATLLPLAARWKHAQRALLYTSFNLLFTLALSLGNILPRAIALPFLLQWAETLWGIYRPAWRWKPTRIGIRQLMVSTLWTLLFILTWRG
ncbi:MAG: YwiC-like family protein [Chloroflexi bacterium]|nr:YwiC-like family protein [Chloroflexota bacterium]